VRVASYSPVCARPRSEFAEAHRLSNLGAGSTSHRQIHMMWPSRRQEPRSPARRYSLAGGKRPLSHLTRAAGAAVAAGGQGHDHSAPLRPLVP
jgi:hypothetical protein